ncbi:hypothetical protein EDD30_5849 [Couchioplanes caeruleus]|uniref:Uncharacterized protein n=1 Tax=Couchioplanes caeruleus TaxID=56438 RepID=A0A3N1GRL4_9ACTN|nr:hypothetical protein EDD30_5849 [Couchioplanes caeruleus]
MTDCTEPLLPAGNDGQDGEGHEGMPTGGTA